MVQTAPNWKAESQANPISKTGAPEDSSITRYNDFENPVEKWLPAFSMGERNKTPFDPTEKYKKGPAPESHHPI